MASAGALLRAHDALLRDDLRRVLDEYMAQQRPFGGGIWRILYRSFVRGTSFRNGLPGIVRRILGWYFGVEDRQYLPLPRAPCKIKPLMELLRIRFAKLYDLIQLDGSSYWRWFLWILLGIVAVAFGARLVGHYAVRDGGGDEAGDDEDGDGVAPCATRNAHFPHPFHPLAPLHVGFACGCGGGRLHVGHGRGGGGGGVERGRASGLRAVFVEPLAGILHMASVHANSGLASTSAHGARPRLRRRRELDGGVKKVAAAVAAPNLTATPTFTAPLPAPDELEMLEKCYTMTVREEATAKDYFNKEIPAPKLCASFKYYLNEKFDLVFGKQKVEPVVKDEAQEVMGKPAVAAVESQ